MNVPADPTKTKFHRDGTVTFWDVYQQTWVRTQGSRISDECLASLSPGERRRIARTSGGAQ